MSALPVPGLKKLRGQASNTALVVLTMISIGAYAQERSTTGSPSNISAKTPEGAFTVAAQEVEFDTSILRQRGLDPALALYFSKAPRFYPGDNIVTVTLNGNSLGRKAAQFNREGKLCFSASFVRSVGLKPIPDSIGNSIPESAVEACPQYAEYSPRTEVTLNPGASTVDIVTPPEYVENAPNVINQHGGVGAMLNYRAYAMESSFGDMPGIGFRQLESTVGVNANDWIFRSQQTYSAQKVANLSSSRIQEQSLYGQKTFVEQRQVLQAGRIYVQDPIFGGTPIIGAQWIPERALVPQSDFAVTGIANSRARVEILQNGVLIHSTLVPPGAFRLSDFPINNRSADLQVKVTEENGAQQTTIVPASSLLLAAEHASIEGLSISAGQLWDIGSLGSLESAPLLSASHGWYFGDLMSGIAGLQLTNNYYSGGIGLNTRLWRTGQKAYIQLLVSNDLEQNRTGAIGSAAMNFVPSPQFQFGFSGNLRSRDYMSLHEAKMGPLMQSNGTGTRAQWGGNLNWKLGAAGGLSANMVRQTSFSGDFADTYAIGWNIPISGAQLGLNLTHSPARYIRNPTTDVSTWQPEIHSIYASLVIPLRSGATSSSSVSRTNSAERDVVRLSTSFDQKVSDYVSYRASVDSVDSQSGATNTTLSAFMMPKYTSMSLGVSQGSNNSTYYGEASGGVVVHREGIAFSPSPIQDSFGVVRVGDLAGVRLNTPSGPVWTGLNGLAAIPALSPFQESRVELDTASIPDDIDVDSGYQSIQAMRGIVLKTDISVSKARRLLLAVVTPDGKELASGTPVLRSDGEYVAPTLSGGRVFVANHLDGQNYVANFGSGEQCTFRHMKIVPRVEGEQFERAVALCE